MKSFDDKTLKSLLCQFYDDLEPDFREFKRSWPVPSVVLGDKIQAKKYRRNLGFQLLVKLVEISYDKILFKMVDMEEDLIQRTPDQSDLDPTKPDYVPETCAMINSETEDDGHEVTFIPETQAVVEKSKKFKKVSPPKVPQKKHTFDEVLGDCHEIFGIEQQDNSPSIIRPRHRPKLDKISPNRPEAKPKVKDEIEITKSLLKENFNFISQEPKKVSPVYERKKLSKNEEGSPSILKSGRKKRLTEVEEKLVFKEEPVKQSKEERLEMIADQIDFHIGKHSKFQKFSETKIALFLQKKMMKTTSKSKRKSQVN